MLPHLAAGYRLLELDDAAWSITRKAAELRPGDPAVARVLASLALLGDVRTL